MALDIIASAFQTGLIVQDEELGWSDVNSRVGSMLKKVDNRTTLFLGAAISTFKPTCLPAWEKFIEFICSFLIDRATDDVGSNSQGQYAHCSKGTFEYLSDYQLLARLSNSAFQKH
jgi:hypothetical protein